MNDLSSLPGLIRLIAPRPDLIDGGFLFLRHGRTGHNLRRIMQGHLDIPLDETGRAEAEAAATLLAGMVRLRRIVSSDLSRARETALAVAARFSLEPALDPDLRERHFGPFEGFPGTGAVWETEAEGMETVTLFADRVATALARHVDGPDTLLVAHGGVLRAIARLLDAELPEGALGNATPLRFSRSGRNWTIELLGTAQAALPPKETLEPL